MLIDGFGISNYRSFGPDIQLFGLLAKINILAGTNNSGKSNALLFLSQHYAGVVESIRHSNAYSKIGGIDRHVGKSTGSSRFALGVALQGKAYHSWRDSLSQRIQEDGRLKAWVDKIYAAFSAGGSVAWFYYQGAWGGQLKLDEDFVTRSVSVLDQNEWNTLWRVLTSRTGGGLLQHWVPEALHALSPHHKAIPQVALIPAIRSIGAGQGAEGDYSGLGLVDRLARIQNPDLPERQNKEQFNSINQFVRTVVGNESATLEVPYKRDIILVHMDGKTLPLSSLGTGVHEVIILAAAATVLTGQVVCIEEPEIHLHPTLQRKLLAYLSEKTNNQYFIATHSAHLLDAPGAQIFRIKYEGGETSVRPAGSPRERAEICADLGYRPSDLLQANSVIWVEGPSDRLYLNHWIRAIASELLEGVHYSIMFYGGRLLSHLSANDPEVTEFISLRRLNRHISILIDSDKRSARASVNDTKKRVVTEFGQGPGFAWVTSGREIENYVLPGILEQAMRTVCPGFSRFAEKEDKYRDPFAYIDSRGGRRDKADKVKVAHEVARHPAELGVLDLAAKVRKIVDFVKTANGME